ncbi:MAG: EamA family transporter [Nanoarchaeota archaeon]
MIWLLLSLIPPFVWGIGSILDKILVSKYIKGLHAGILTNLVSGLLPLLILPFFHLKQVSLNSIFWIVCAGILWGCARLFYCLAISKEEASRVIPFFQISPVLILIFSFFFLHDTINSKQALGFTAILAGVLWISVRKKEKKLHITDALGDLIIYTFFITSAFLLLKAFSKNDLWVSMIFLNIGFALSTVPFLIFNNNWQNVIKDIKKQPKPLFTILISLALLTLIGRSTFFAALAIAPAAIVTIVSSVQALFVLVFATYLSINLPHLIKEDVSIKVLVSKTGAILLILLGVAILAFA